MSTICQSRPHLFKRRKDGWLECERCGEVPFGTLTEDYHGDKDTTQRKLEALASALPGVIYAGPTKLKYLVHAEGDWHALSVKMPSGRMQAILCRTQDQAERIAAMAQYAEEQAAALRRSA